MRFVPKRIRAISSRSGPASKRGIGGVGIKNRYDYLEVLNRLRIFPAVFETAIARMKDELAHK